MPASRYLAASTSAGARAWLAAMPNARVLSVFDRVCNLISDGRKVMCIVSSANGNGPFAIVVAESLTFSSFLNVDSAVSVLPEQVSLAGAVIDIRHAVLWPSRPDWVQLHSAREHIAAQLHDLDGWIRAGAPGGSLIDLLPRASNSRADKIPGGRPQDSGKMDMAALGMAAIHGPAGELSLAVAAGDLLGCQRLAQRLAGAGPGLTPAGDDYILGAIYAAWIVHPLDTAAAIARALASAATPVTTSLSAAWLEAAARGEASEAWHALLASLFENRWSAMCAAIARLLQTGHTSGADGLAGFSAVLAGWSQLEMRRAIR